MQRGSFVSLTYDAFAKSLLDHFMYALPVELRPNSNYLVGEFNVIDAAFRSVGYNNPDGLPTKKLNTFYDDSLSTVSLPITGTEYRHRVWPLLLQGFDSNKATLTFKMIMMLAIHIIQTNPLLKRALQMTYSYVFLDEFQDTTTLQYAFVKECFLGSNVKITAVGDNKQRIMLWAGAMRGIFKTFHQEFEPYGVRLLMNHRSAPKLVSLQKAMYTSLKERTTDVKVPDKWKTDEGDITLVIAEKESAEATTIVSDIVNRISTGIQPNDICILCKQLPQKYTLQIIKKLEQCGIRARIENDYQDLIKEPIVDLFLNFMLCVCDRKHPVEWSFVENTLLEIWGIGTTQENAMYDQMLLKLSSFADEIAMKVHAGLDSTQWHFVLSEMLQFFDTAKIKAMFPQYMQGTFFDDLICEFEKLFWNEYLASEGNWNLAIENFRGEHSIPIMTIHKSKGLEYTAVYFIGLEDAAFWNFKNNPDEDRCAFFVALSRAKKAVTFTFCKNRLNFKYTAQKHTDINEFFMLLQQPGIANVIFT